MSQAFTLHVDEQGLARLVFDLQGEKVNKFSEPVIIELEGILTSLKERNDIKVMTVESAKDGIFIAGADINELAGITEPAEGEDKARKGQAIFNQTASLPFPTVAVIDGACLGGGLEFALSCTYRVVTDNKKTLLGCPEVQLGILPGWGGTQRLPRLIGLPESLTMILTGKPVSGSKAYRIGLADAYAAKEFVEEKKEEFLKYCLTASGRKAILRKRSRSGLVSFLLERNPIGRRLIFSKAEKNVLRKSKGNYPAPILALKVIRDNCCGPIEKGLQEEAAALGELASGRICKNLIQLFFTNEELKKDKGVENEVNAAHVTSAGVVGAGVMGGGISWLLGSQDIRVRLKDVNWDAVCKGFASALDYYKQLLKRRKIKPGEMNLGMHRISGTVDYSGFQDLDVVVEAVVEDLDVKKKVLAEIEKNVRPDTILCSNTSSLSVSEMAGALERPENFIGMHFFNPVNRMPLVEVVPGEKTSPETIVTIFALAKRCKKVPVLVRDCSGFLINRILLSYMNEAVRMLEEGADISRVDNMIAHFGLPMGPFTLADEVGIDVCYKVMEILAQAYGQRMKTTEILRVLYKEDHLLGKKAGKGFYIYQAGKKAPNPLLRSRVDSVQKKLGIKPVTFSDKEIVDRCILIMINEAGRCLEENIVSKASYLDMALILGIGFPPFRGGLLRCADEAGIEETVKRLNKLAEKYGERFQPAELLVAMAKDGGRFYT